MGAWAEQVSPWHDVFAAATSASATLLGLLFVGLSLHVRLVVEHEDVRALARQTFTGRPEAAAAVWYDLTRNHAWTRGTAWASRQLSGCAKTRSSPLLTTA
jgi:hypothetical protein